jgi:hypothetical protein
MKRLNANPCDATTYPISNDTEPWIRENTVRNSLEKLDDGATASKRAWQGQRVQQEHDCNRSAGKHLYGSHC